MSAFEPEAEKSPSGATLAVRRMGPSGKPRAVIQITHGMGEHGARYRRFAKCLSEAGYAAIVHDHRGHGQTTARDAPEGRFADKNGLEKVLTDMVFVNGLARDMGNAAPVVLFGHSMGSILGLNFCIRHSERIGAAALWNSGVDSGWLLFIYSALLKIERAFKGSDVPSRIALKLTFQDWNRKFAPNRTEFDWLSRDEIEVDKYVADPYCGISITVGLWLDVVRAIRIGALDTELANIRKNLPFHLVGGVADPCTKNGQSMRRLAERLRKTGVEQVSLNLLAGTRHESLNEINRETTTVDFIAWLDEHFS